MSLRDLVPEKEEIEEAIITNYGQECAAFFRKGTTEIIRNWVPYIKTLFDDIEKDYDEETITTFTKVWSAVKGEYMSAPASSNRKYHSAHPMGLAMHSIEVYRFAKHLATSWEGFTAANGKQVIINNAELLLCGLFHDLGKAGNGEGKPYYTFEESEWHRDKLGRLYSLDYDNYALGHAETSIFWLTKLVPINMSIYQAIRFHDGQYIQENKVVAHKELELTLLMQHADYYVSHMVQV